MKLADLIGKKILFFDGAMGTELQKRGLQPGIIPETWNLLHPEVVQEIHREYLHAGAKLLKTCTFGVNAFKFQGTTYKLTEIVQSAIRNAKAAMKDYPDAYLCLDIGPLGKLLQPYGDLPFEKAVELFGEVVRAGAAEADAVLIETMGDTLEMKAAILAAKENCSLPIFATFTFDKDGRMLNGADAVTACCMAERLGVAAVGFNCGVGPEQLKNLVAQISDKVNIPIVVNPNAGLPKEVNGKTIYDVEPQEFAALSKELIYLGASLLGGCCGTNPRYIAELVQTCKECSPVVRKVNKLTSCSSFAKTIVIDDDPKIIGERINPTGKKTLQTALKNKDLDYICRLALEQGNAGAHILDVNVGMPGINEEELLPQVVQILQGITDIPLQIDTANPVAAEKALRVYNGIPLLNSVNASAKSLDAVLPLVAKYGATVIALTLDDKSIPATAAGRLTLVDKILAKAAEYGIGKERIIVDPLALTIGADPNNAKTVLSVLRTLKERGIRSLLGVSNISFGLPNRAQVNSTFFALALEAGLSLGIINPQTQMMLDTYYAYRALGGHVKNLRDLTNKLGEKKNIPVTQVREISLYDAIVQGLVDSAKTAVAKELASAAPMDLVNNRLIPALNKVGVGFEMKTVFLPQLLMSADAAKAAFEIIKQQVGSNKTEGPTVILATVEGDIHDIGKNIVKAVMENYGFRVVDLGKDVPVEKVVQAAQEEKPLVIGLSALMTTTVPAMEKTISALKNAHINSKILVGGAVLTAEYAAKIGADAYAANAVAAVNFSKSQKK